MNTSRILSTNTLCIMERATLGGGGFWCLEAAYQHVDGVASLVSDSTPAIRSCSAQDDNIKTERITTRSLTCDRALPQHWGPSISRRRQDTPAFSKPSTTSGRYVGRRASIRPSRRRGAEGHDGCTSRRGRGRAPCTHRTMTSL